MEVQTMSFIKRFKEKLSMDKAGVVKANTNVIGASIAGIIAVVILFQVLADLVPELIHAGNNLSSTGLPLVSLLDFDDGIMGIVFVASIILFAIFVFGIGGKGRK